METTDSPSLGTDMDISEPDAVKDVEELVEAFFQDCKIRNLAVITMDIYRVYLRTFVTFCREKGIDPVRIGDDGILAFLAHLRQDRHNCPKSVRNTFTALSSFYQYLLFIKKVLANPIPHISNRYLRTYKTDGERPQKKVLSVPEMADLIGSIPDVRDRAILMVLAKTGVRRNELITLDVEDVDMEKGQIVLKPTTKRSNRVLFIDDECIQVVTEWIVVRARRAPTTKALFLSRRGGRIKRGDVYRTVREWAELFGYSDPVSRNRGDRLGPHCFRHWFTTHLIRNGMSRDHVKELRGDARKEAIDIYNHIDKEELRRAYLKAVPRLMDQGHRGPSAPDTR